MLVNKWAFAGEKVIHGTPSGIDNSVSAYGGALHFVKGHQPVELSAVPRLRILLVNTKVPVLAARFIRILSLVDFAYFL